MPNVDNEVGFTMDMYPGVGKPPEATYSEELLVGYRSESVGGSATDCRTAQPYR